MTCLEAQSNIMKFIDKTLPDDKVVDFARHIKHCPNCAEELEISYTLIIGMRQLDNNEDLCHDFKAAIKDDFQKAENKIKTAKRFKVSTFSMIFAAEVVCLLFLYDQGLNKVYEIEQTIKSVEQGDAYFYEEFSDILSICQEDFVNEYTVIEPKPGFTFYQKIKLYNYIHPNKDEDEDETKGYNIN